ncbi:hypothetical protein ABW20_dc0105049 [Dactylellina cionopaga]|nr:hypothetical protein ABW20_dc0105049 [Dactylellina cionopaga]
MASLKDISFANGVSLYLGCAARHKFADVKIIDCIIATAEMYDRNPNTTINDIADYFAAPVFEMETFRRVHFKGKDHLMKEGLLYLRDIAPTLPHPKFYPALIPLVVAFTVVGTLVMTARFYSRLSILGRIPFYDWLMLIGFVSTWFTSKKVKNGGLLRWVIIATFVVSLGSAVPATVVNLVYYGKVDWWNYILDPSFATLGWLNYPMEFMVTGALNILTDVIIWVIPIILIWGPMRKRGKPERIATLMLFILGAVVCVTGALRIATFWELTMQDGTGPLAEIPISVWTM